MQMLTKDKVPERAATYWTGSASIFVKKDGSLRLSFNNKKLETVSVRDSSPLPFLKDCFGSLKKVSIFSALHVSSGYWQI